METKEILPSFPPGASKLLVDLLGLNSKELTDASDNCQNYKTIKIKKRSSGFRTINNPQAALKKFQQRLLQRWLYRIYFRNFLDSRIYSFIPGRSTTQSIQAHADNLNGNYLIRFDLKDAFPSITTELVRRALHWAIEKEFDFLKDWKNRKEDNRYNWKDVYSKNPLFPRSKVRWFRKLIRKPGNDLFVDDIIERYVDKILGMTIYQDSLPQGAPTSPFLLNLVISYLQLPSLITSWLKVNGYKNYLTVYCDDFIISTFRPPTSEILSGIVNVIETVGLKVNPKKTKVYNRHQVAPSVLGLKLVRLYLKAEEIRPLFRRFPRVRGTLRRYRQKKIWQHNKVSVSKKYVRQTRAMMHNLALSPNDEKLNNVVHGRLNYLKSVYGKYCIPHQLLKPYQEMIGSGIKLKMFYVSSR